MLQSSVVSSDAVVRLAASGLESYPGPVFVMDATGTVLLANEPGGAVADRVPTETADALLVAARQVIRSGGAERVMIELQGLSGKTFYDLTILPLAAGTGVLVLGHDRTLEENLRMALVESRGRYKDLVHISSDFAWETDTDGIFCFVSGVEVLGYRPDQLVGHTPADVLMDPAEKGEEEVLFRTRTPVDNIELWVRRADGRSACLAGAALPLFDGTGALRGVRGVCRDVTDLRERDAVLARVRNRERLLSHVVRTFWEEVEPENMLGAAAGALVRSMAADGCQIFRLDEKRQELGAAEVFFLGAAAGEVGEVTSIMPALSMLQQGGDTLELVIGGWQVLGAATRHEQAMNGAVVLWRSFSRGSWDDDDRILVGDIALQVGVAIEQVANHAEIVSLSRTDALTGLFNRRAFMDDLGRRFGRMQRDGRTGAALMYVDLDNFKLVNDVHGHKRGDEALVRVRDILVANTRSTDLVARLGGDEFAIWLEGADAEAAVRRAEALLNSAAPLNEFSGDPARPLLMSLGIAVYDPGHAETLDDLLARADAAMYAVKRSGKGNYRIAPAAG
ncbi:MAG: sensor domain-containing diguanylate cyclase [Alphaproteobacteria bacterium]